MTAAVDLEDPFATPAEASLTQRRADVITGGRYRLPNRDGSHRKGGWTRVTNLVSAISDQYRLQQWEMRTVLRGLVLRPDLHEAMRSLVETDDPNTEAYRDEVARIAEQAKEAAGGSDGSRNGSMKHAMVEAHHGGLPVGTLSERARLQLASYVDQMHVAKLRALPGMQERRVIIERFSAAGTLDNILECLLSGVLYIGDLKTQKRFWTWLEICAQLACYAHADAMWVPEESGVAGHYVDMPPVDRSRAIVAWMPEYHPNGEPGEVPPEVHLYEVDIEWGWEVAQEAHRVVQLRSEGARKREPRGWLRPAPEVTAVEAYARRFAAVSTMAEGSALVAEAHRRGLWCPELESCAKAAAARLTVTRI
ncbi:MAG TPA: hypothetical protein VFU47_14285 [Armatimonadota bacterium]|nr:hypothetical protein [Armatimonadota bacterium]